jgi:hypothetical protein
VLNSDDLFFLIGFLQVFSEMCFCESSSFWVKSEILDLYENDMKFKANYLIISFIFTETKKNFLS